MRRVKIRFLVLVVLILVDLLPACGLWKSSEPQVTGVETEGSFQKS
jgi:hypothetical protein